MSNRNIITKGKKITSALKQKRHIERIVVDKIKFQGKKESYKKKNSNKIMQEERELNVNKKTFLTQSEIVRLKELIRDLNHIYPEALRKNGLMEWCNKVLAIYEISLDDFRSKRRWSNLVQARIDFCHVVKEKTEFNYNEIAKFMNRDHTSILHLVKNKQPKYLEVLCQS